MTDEERHASIGWAPGPPAAGGPGADEALRALVLRGIMEGTFSAVGEEFFRLLACGLASALKARYAFITECVEPPPEAPSHVRTVAFWTGRDFGASFEYALSGTPCEEVLGEKTCVCYPEALQSLYPRDAQLAELGAESYMGVPLLTPAGRLLGHLAIMDDRRIVDVEAKREVLRAFAVRAAAEMDGRQRRRERERVIVELRQASSRTLTGLIPICAWCKRLRDEQGNWEEAELYIHKHTQADFTHGICPDCVREHGCSASRR